MIDNIKSWRMTVETAAKRRIFTEILVHGNRSISWMATRPPTYRRRRNSRLVQILDENGVRIRYRSVGSTERVR